jgi:hypothetical protein
MSTGMKVSKNGRLFHITILRQDVPVLVISVYDGPINNNETHDCNVFPIPYVAGT